MIIIIVKPDACLVFEIVLVYVLVCVFVSIPEGINNHWHDMV